MPTCSRLSSAADFGLALVLAAAFSITSKGGEKMVKEQLWQQLLKVRFSACWMRSAGESAVVCGILLGFYFSG